jgi:DNA polymerase-3 subunit alpha
LIAFQTAYLKAHFPVELMASLLTSEMHSTDGVVKYMAECRSHGIDVLPPDINESDREFTVTGSKIRFGLVAVKNVGEGAIEAIIDARSEGRFSSLFDFCERVELKKVNKRVVESLIKCGALDSTGDYRSRMTASLEDAIDYGQRIQKEKSDPQMGLFDMGGGVEQTKNHPSMPTIGEWDEKQLLAFEKESLGFYMTGHPLTRYEDLLEKFTDTDTVSLKDKNDGEVVRIGGVVRSTKTITTKRGALMAFATIEDLHGSIEATIFSSVFQTAHDLLAEDTPILIQGSVQKDENSAKILADTIIPIDKADEIWSASVHFVLDLNRTEKASLVQLHNILKRHFGSCKAYIHLQNPGKTETVLALPDNLKLKPGASLAQAVNGFLGYNAVKTVCNPATSYSKPNHTNKNSRTGNI